MRVGFTEPPIGLALRTAAEAVHLTVGASDKESMSGPQRPRLSAYRDCAWRAAFRLGFPLARVWWRLTTPQHEGAVVAIHVGPALLLVRCSYRVGWHLPGGSVRRGERPETAARRELAEEIGLVVTELHPVGTACRSGTDDVTGYTFLSCGWQRCRSCGLTIEKSSRLG